MPQKRSPLSLWIQALRAPFFTASAIPVVLAACLAVYFGDNVLWAALPAVLSCVILLHAGTNLTNDYYDYQNGVDKPSSFGSSRVLVDGILPPRRILIASYVFFGCGLIIGIALVFMRGFPLLIIGLTGLTAGYLYTGKPKGLKYIGLGDVIVFLFMGPVLAAGAYLALTGSCPVNMLYASLPVGFLVTAILHANNIRDLKSDKEAHIRTFAQILGLRVAKTGYNLLIVSAFVSVAIMAALRILPPVSLAVGLSLPLALRNMRAMNAAQDNNLQSLAAIDVLTAQLHLVFGLLYIISLIIAHFIR